MTDSPTDSPTDALAFFRQSCGRWRSRRSSHHLLHRRAEAGSSFIEVLALGPEDPRLIAIATLHGQDPTGLVGGCQVRWSGSMAWDKAGEAHEGESLFGLIPTDDLGREGLLLRDRGYAETAPVAGRFAMDANHELLLTTDYETMSSVERFSFLGPNVRLRSSTVEGLSNTASFCIETRLVGCETGESPLASSDPEPAGPVRGPTTAPAKAKRPLSPLGW